MRSLDLWGSAATDEGVQELAGLKHLQTLNIGQTKVTDARLKEALARAKSSRATVRKWSDRSGKFSFEGELVKVAGGKVYLKSGGRVKEIPLDHLSDADRQFIESVQGKTDKTPATKP